MLLIKPTSRMETRIVQTKNSYDFAAQVSESMISRHLQYQSWDLLARYIKENRALVE